MEWLNYFTKMITLPPLVSTPVVEEICSVSSRTSQDEISISELIDSLNANPNYSFENEPKKYSKVDINSLDLYGYNLFHRSIISGNKELVFEFLSHNVDLYKTTSYGRTPLQLALFYKQNEIAIMIWNKMK